MSGAIFVSYSQPDRGCAFELVTHLESFNLPVWVAPRDITPGGDWAAEIIEAISAARLMVLVFSEHCNNSPQVRREVERAIHRQVPVLPFRIEDVLPARSLEYFLSSQHWFDAFPEPRESHYCRLCDHIVALLSREPEVRPRSTGSETTRIATENLRAAMDTSTPQETARSPNERPRQPGNIAPNRSLVVLGAEELQSLERGLAFHVGPLARVLVRRALAQAVDREQLTTLLAAEVEPGIARQQFLERCRNSR